MSVVSSTIQAKKGASVDTSFNTIFYLIMKTFNDLLLYGFGQSSEITHVFPVLFKIWIPAQYELKNSIKSLGLIDCLDSPETKFLLR